MNVYQQWVHVHALGVSKEFVVQHVLAHRVTDGQVNQASDEPDGVFQSKAVDVRKVTDITTSLHNAAQTSCTACSIIYV